MKYVVEATKLDKHGDLMSRGAIVCETINEIGQAVVDLLLIYEYVEVEYLKEVDADA